MIFVVIDFYEINAIIQVLYPMLEDFIVSLSIFMTYLVLSRLIV